MQKLTAVPEVPAVQLCKHMIGQNEPILPFEIDIDMEEGACLKWKLLTYQGPT